MTREKQQEITTVYLLLFCMVYSINAMSHIDTTSSRRPKLHLASAGLFYTIGYFLLMFKNKLV
jgi:hypothetical protein